MPLETGENTSDSPEPKRHPRNIPNPGGGAASLDRRAGQGERHENRHHSLVRADRPATRPATHIRQLPQLRPRSPRSIALHSAMPRFRLTLDQVRDLLLLSSREDQNCAEVDRVTAENLAAGEQKAADHQHFAAVLRRISSQCQAPARDGHGTAHQP